jgi:pimeloyl-ACP methyl ester carboxylesterase
MALAHDEQGSGPAIVLLHAGVADRTMWAEHLGPLAQAGHRAVAVDLPGYGDSPASPGEQAEWLDVIATLDELRIERAALVGNSFGGAVALRAALVAPGRVSALVLVSAPPPVFEPSPELQAAWDAEEEALSVGDYEAAVDAVVDAWTLLRAPPELRERVAAMQWRTPAFRRGGPEPTPAFDPLEVDPAAIERIAVPALVAAGEHDMSDFRDGAEAMACALPAARHAVIADAGHLAPLETPGAFRELVLDFLSRLR